MATSDPRTATARTRVLLEAADLRRKMERWRSLVVELRAEGTALCDEAAAAIESMMSRLVV